MQSTKHRHVKYTLRNWTSSWCVRLEVSVIKGLIKPPMTHIYNEIKLFVWPFVLNTRYELVQVLNAFPQRMLSDQETACLDLFFLPVN